VIIATGFFLRSEPVSMVCGLLVLEVILFSEFLTLFKLIRAVLAGKRLKNQSLRMKVDNRLIIDNLEDDSNKQ
jgi:hypothetical protein